jgi:hypothetical protein
MKHLVNSGILILAALAIMVLPACSSKKTPESQYNDTNNQTNENQVQNGVYDTSYTPIKTVRVAFHVFQHSSGERSFTNNEKDLDFFRNTISRASNLLANLQPLEPLNSPDITSPYIKDSRIRLLLDTIFFRVDDEIYDGFSKAGIVFQHARTAHTRHILQNPDLTETQKYNTLHVIVAGTWDTHGGQVSGIGNKDLILFKGWYDRFAKGNSDGCIHTFVHELGHSMGLHHIFAPNNCNQCKDLGCFERGETNNIMSLSPSKMNAMSLCQFEIAHEYLSGKKGNIGDVVTENKN